MNNSSLPTGLGSHWDDIDTCTFAHSKTPCGQSLKSNFWCMFLQCIYVDDRRGGLHKKFSENTQFGRIAKTKY